MNPISVYVHIPFCPSKCGYCDFNSYAMEGEIQPRTASAIAKEIRRSTWAGVPAKTIFFGGGTPTYLPVESLLEIFQAVVEIHPPVASAEITSEANPGTVDVQKFRAMGSAGFNRLSLGAQSFHADDLVRLDRIHAVDDISRAVGAAREAGFDNLNLDLMFGLPKQSARGWSSNLDRAFALNPDHISLYGLTIEPNTAFYKRHLRGELDLPNEDLQVDMYENCCDRSEREGFAQYEISNFSKPGRECQHNLAYWRHEDYAAYGPGAVSCMTLDSGRKRETRIKHPERYCQAIESEQNLIVESDLLTPEAEQVERIMLGLRLNEGFAWPASRRPERTVAELCDRGWLAATPERITLTKLGRHFCSEVALHLIG